MASERGEALRHLTFSFLSFSLGLPLGKRARVRAGQVGECKCCTPFFLSTDQHADQRPRATMSDDGLLLNFAANGTASQPRRSLTRGRKGGQATRRTAQLEARPLASQPKEPAYPASSSTVTQGPSGAVSAARKSSDSSTAPHTHKRTPVVSTQSTSASPPTSSPAQQRKSASGSQPSRRTAVISSLFAGDDALRETLAREDDKNESFDPSNAPSKASDFASLRLDPLLVAHLASEKMNIVRPTGIQRSALPFLLSSSSYERDALLHAQTGSGKTLCYLLPIIQSLLPYCEASWIDRSCLGTLAIILVPTRELARQIYEVAETLCSMHLTSKAAKDEKEEETNSIRRARWIVPGLLSGGATKNHEKSRLRKGLPLIVATPGRLLDHLRTTAAFDVGRLQWLVLDEADRLLQLGFEETLNDILKAIDGRRRAASELQRQRMREELGNQYGGETIDEADVIDTFGEAWWKHGRRTVLCSATLDESVQVLAGKSLRDPKVIRSDAEGDETAAEVASLGEPSAHISAPAQLSQNFMVVPTKQRLVILVALLRRAIAVHEKAKVMVFLSCTDSVDFHLSALAGVTMARGEEGVDDGDEKDKIEHSSELLPSTSLYKLHGSLSAQNRQSSLKAFSQCKQGAVLFCTSVASRGLDLHVSYVIQVDAPTEKGADEYLHRIGRTARAGEQGESWLILLPSEEGCIAHYEAAIGDQEGGARPVIHRREPTAVLRDGFGGADLLQTQTRATDAQMALERWTVATDSHASLARRAYLAHLRAYATHPPSERSIFAIAKLQLGHLAKAFALREAPGEIRAKSLQASRAKAHAVSQSAMPMNGQKRKRNSHNEPADVDDGRDGGKDDAEEEDLFDGRRSSKVQFQRNEETEARMYAKVRELGKLHKRAGVLGAHGGADEFQIG